MKTHTLRTLFAMIIAMLCALFAPPQQAQAQEAYVHQSPDKATLTFFYDTQRNARQGQTWGIEETKTVSIKIRGKKISFTIPAWTGFIQHANTVTEKAVFDESFKNFRPTSTKQWFLYLEALHTIEGLKYLNTSQVTDMASMFANCEKLTTLDLTSFNPQKVTNMASMFAQCNQLQTILCNSTWQCKNSKDMFQGCTALKGAVAFDASKLDVTMANPNTGYFTIKLEAYVQMSPDQKTLTFFYDKQRYTRQGQTWGINEKRTDITSFPAWAGIYQNPNTTTTKAVFDASFQNFKPTSTNHWFVFYEKLASIEGFQYLNTSEVTNMRYMFANCSSLTNLDLKNFNTEKVTDMIEMFNGCSALTTLDLSKFNTSNVTEMNGMFWNCAALKTLNLSKFNTKRVTNMSSMFSGCSALTNLDLKNFNTEEVKVMSWMFAGCSALTTIYCPNTWQCNKSEDMFYNCTKLKGAVAYDDSKTDATMANPTNGYFTKDKPGVDIPEAYVHMSQDKTTLTFFYDKQRYNRQGQTWGINENRTDLPQVPAWAGFHQTTNTTTKAVFDASFQNFKPTSTAYWLFFYKKLTSIEGFQYLNTSEVTDMSGMFANCKSLTALDLKNFNTQKVESMSSMFAQCSALTTLDLSKFNTSNVKEMRELFFFCTSLTNLDLTSFNTQKVESMSSMFAQCSALTTLDLSKFNTSNVTDMNGMFNSCSALTNLDLKNFNTEKVKDMSGMFAGCSALTNLDLSQFNTKNVTKMNAMFYKCSALTTIYCPYTWQSNESEDMFAGCTQLKGAVAYDKNKTDVTMANPNTGYFTNKAQEEPEITTPEAYVHMSPDQTTLTFFYDKQRKSRQGQTWGIEELNEEELPAWAPELEGENTTTTKAVFDASFKNFNPTSTVYWLFSYTALTAIEGLDNLNTSEVTDMSYMFYGCSRLKEITLSNFNTEKVTKMEGMFYSCSGLKELNLSNFNTEKVKDMSYLFSGCSGLKELNLSNFNTEKVTDMTGMFKGCSALTNLDLKNFKTEKVTYMSDMFSGCSALTSLDLKSFKTEKVERMWNMFVGCASLKTIDLSNFKTEKMEYMTEMFSGCSALTTIYCPNTWQSKESKDMFLGCTALQGAVKYDASKLDVTMANPNTGYFTAKKEDKPVVDTPEAYVHMSPDQTTLTFFYDTQRKSRQGQTWGINEKRTDIITFPAWASIYQNPNTTTTKAVFDASFQNFKPTSTNRWFIFYQKLTTIEGIQYLNTSEVTDMSYMFSDCKALTAIDLSNFNTEKVEQMRNMFDRCSSLTSLDLTSFNTEKVTNMDVMFSGCSALQTLNLSNFKTEKVTNMRRMFAVCNGLKELNLSNFKTEKVENLQAMFSDCAALTAIYCPNTWQCKESEDMFAGCTKLQGAVKYDASKLDVTMANPNNGYFTKEKKPEAYVQLSSDQKTLTFYYDKQRASREGTTWGIEEKRTDNPDFPAWAGTNNNPNTTTTKAVVDASFKDFRPTSTAYWFMSYQKLATIEGLQYLNSSEVTNMNGMFAACNGLNELNLSYFKTQKVEKMNYMFADCRSLTGIDLSTFNTSNVKNMSGMFNGCSALTSLDLKNFNTQKVTDMDWMFANCSAFTTLDLKSFNTQNVTDMRGMFFACSSLTSLDLKSFNTQKVTDMRKMFENCSGLTSLNLSKFNTEKVEDMSYMFENCSALTTLDLKSFNTEKVEDMSLMFKSCIALTSLDLKNFNTEKVENMMETFSDCSALKSLNLSGFNTSNATTMNYMFSGCSALTSLDLMSFNPEKVKDMRYMFSRCASLTTIYNPYSWKSQLTSNMFKGCKKLKGAVAYDDSKTDVEMANPTTGYFTKTKPTAIEQMFLNAHKAQGIYTLQGKRVSGDFQHLPAGVYIVNGVLEIRR